jgi:membrane-bound lytic murein transglycosylase B
LAVVGPFQKVLAASDEFGPNPTWLRKEMKKMGLPAPFVREALQSYEPEGFATVTKLNLLGFLQPAGQHMDRVTSESVRETAEFLKEYQKDFDRAEKKYKVPANVVSALLWIETRHGEDKGRFHILSVYMHLLQVERSSIRKELTSLAFEKNRQNDQGFSEKELKKIMKERTRTKSDWAREQLMALAQLQKKHQLNLKTLRGSYAGAFGIPQFIPTSYRDFARAAQSKSAPDLTKPQDSIMSVAHYLSKHGWKSRRPKTHLTALMKYNNSRDYAESILQISKKAQGETSSASKSRGVSSSRP